MRWILLSLTAFFLFSCQKQDLTKVQIVKVFDGDSFLVERLECPKCTDEERIFQVRMLGMDAPESKQGIWGEKSRDKLLSLMNADRQVFIEYDIDKLDKYKRHLAYVYADSEGEELINEKMISSGHAELFAFSKDLKYLRRFKEAERKAKLANLGIWDLETGTELSPYEYRRKNKRH